jgi:sec-independent protein translocase protein TatA
LQSLERLERSDGVGRVAQLEVHLGGVDSILELDARDLAQQDPVPLAPLQGRNGGIHLHVLVARKHGLDKADPLGPLAGFAVREAFQIGAELVPQGAKHALCIAERHTAYEMNMGHGPENRRRRIAAQQGFFYHPPQPGGPVTGESLDMGHMSIWHWLIVLVVVLVLFGGRGKISQLAGDLGKGINAFKKNIKTGQEEEKAEEARRALDANPIAGERVKKDEAAKT